MIELKFHSVVLQAMFSSTREQLIRTYGVPATEDPQRRTSEMKREKKEQHAKRWSSART